MCTYMYDLLDKKESKVQNKSERKGNEDKKGNREEGRREGKTFTHRCSVTR